MLTLPVKEAVHRVLDIVLESLFFCVLQIFSHVAQKLPFLVCCVAHTVAVLEYVVLLPDLQVPHVTPGASTRSHGFHS